MVKIIKLVIVVLGLFIVIGIFPVLLNIIFLIRDRDVIINYKEYDRKTINIDSIRFEDNEGVDTEWVYGYSKELADYKTTVLFNSVKEKDFKSELGMDENGKIIREVWFREKSNYAYPAEKGDKTFPIKAFLYNYLKLPIFWIMSILVSIVFYRIVKRNV